MALWGPFMIPVGLVICWDLVAKFGATFLGLILTALGQVQVGRAHGASARYLGIVGPIQA